MLMSRAVLLSYIPQQENWCMVESGGLSSWIIEDLRIHWRRSCETTYSGVRDMEAQVCPILAYR